ncbi:hypothetical protein EJ08DRAFT_732708 [Tothia fuscella]|uniref:DNA-directed RNA polymerase III subunit RPC3 n=1 Tax=Tothia fuscella TaxID=1048955 RepID=A0A9P4TZB0_9PEZI|nr:hypothetical protein EJ08DRAFT_732708 [Tothia fuscella]
MKQHLTDLLTYTVSNLYGDFYSSIFAELAHNGRTTLRALLPEKPVFEKGDSAAIRAGKQSAYQSEYRSRATAIAVLIKLQMVVAYENTYTGETSVEPHWDNAYNITIRAPAILQHVEERHGAHAAEVFDSILRGGITRVQDLIDPVKKLFHDANMKDAKDAEDRPKVDLDMHDSPHSQRSVNGADDVPTQWKPEFVTALQTSIKDIYASTELLLQLGLLEVVGEHQVIPHYDLRKEVTATIENSFFLAGVAGKKAKEEFANKVDQLERDWRDEAHRYFHGTETAKTKKRDRSVEMEDLDAQPAKRLKMLPNGNCTPNATLSGAATEFADQQQRQLGTLDPKLVLRVNFEKCNVGLRNLQLIRLAHRYVGETTSKVYEALLRVVEDKLIRCWDPLAVKNQDTTDYDENMAAAYPLIKTSEVAKMLDPDLNLDIGLSGMELAPPTENGDTDGANSPIARNRKRNHIEHTAHIHKIERHLQLLAVDCRGFVNPDGRDWRVPFDELTQTLIDVTIEDHVTARYGTLPARVLRILKKTGNLEEKQLVERNMVDDKDIRPAITQLTQGGFLKLQELPRDNARSVNRMVWTHKYDVLKTRKQIIDDTYKAMFNQFLRIETQKERIGVLMEKTERIDMEGDEILKHVSEGDRAKLVRWGEVEEILLRQVVRMDELVGVLRDYSAMEVNALR